VVVWTILPSQLFIIVSGRHNDWCFLCEFQSHVERASQSTLPFSPINIISRLPNIGGNLGYGRQEDAHEFMRFLLVALSGLHILR
jgi:hypothetical protein